MHRYLLLACLPFLIFPESTRADWNQIYLTAGLGADALTDDGRISPPKGPGHVSYGGPVGGDVGWEVSAGIDAQLGQMFVVGAFANLDWSNIDTTGAFHSQLYDSPCQRFRSQKRVDGRWPSWRSSDTLDLGIWPLGLFLVRFRQSAGIGCR